MDKIVRDAGNEDDFAFVRNFDAMEFPQLVSEVADYLQPNNDVSVRPRIETYST